MNSARRFAIQSGSLLIILVLAAHINAERETTHLGARIMDPNGNCLTPDDLTKALKQLSGNYNEAETVRPILLRTAKKSRHCRQQIVSAIMTAMDEPGLDISRDQMSYYLWLRGSELLGELKAEEALDLLVSHILMSNGEWSVTMSQQPALGGIIAMGPIAVPKLRPLLRSSDLGKRHFAVYCIAQIGGLSALQALKRALPSETDACTKRFIKASITALDNKKHLFKDKPDWLTAFLCTGRFAMSHP